MLSCVSYCPYFPQGLSGDLQLPRHSQHRLWVHHLLERLLEKRQDALHVPAGKQGGLRELENGHADPNDRLEAVEQEAVPYTSAKG